MPPTNTCPVTPLTSSKMYCPSSQLYNYFQIKAISETSLHISIHSSKINTLLPILLTNNKTVNDRPTNLGSSSLVASTHSPLVNGLGNPSPGIPSRSSLAAWHLISAALQHHDSLSTMVTNSDDPDLQHPNIIFGHLPVADMLFNYHCSSLPNG